MGIQPLQPMTPDRNRFVRWGLRGGAVASALPLMAVLTMNTTFETGMLVVTVVGLIGGLFGAAVAAGVQRGASPMGRFEKELEQARKLLRRELIDEEDYQRLKDRAMEAYRPGAAPPIRIWEGIGWGAYAGIALSSMFFILTEYMGAGYLAVAAGAGIIGAIAAGGTARMLPTIIRVSGLELPAPENRRLLDK